MRIGKTVGDLVGQFTSEPIQEAPYDIVYAVNEALTVLSWHENLPKDEVPPRHIWWSPERIDAWFGKVQENRDRKYGGGNSRKSTYDAADDAPMTRNKLVDRDGLIPTNGGREVPI